MIIGIGVFHPLIEQQVDFTWDKSEPHDIFLLPNYHLTVKKIEKFKKITAILIPSKPDCVYSAKALIEHIRLSDNENIKHALIRILIKEDFCTEEIVEDIENIDVGVEFHYETENQLGSLKTVLKEDFIKQFKSLGNSPQFTDRHTLANTWGPYRVCSFLDALGLDQNGMKVLKENIKKDSYFKKLLLQNKCKTSIETGVSIEVEKYLSYVKKTRLKIAIIDDDYLNGWDLAYKSIFPMSSIRGFNYEGGDTFIPKTASDYDLILLDLRLTEVSENTESDILGMKDMSGIKILNEIKTECPLVPVIMCTASNKSWSSQTALDNGANGYWEKESPDYGLSFEYNLKNTINLLKTIESVLKWSKHIRPFIDSVDQIVRLFKTQKLRDSVAIKKDAIIGQLHQPPSQYIRNNYHFDNEVVSFLILWSILNEIKQEIIVEKDNEFFVHIDGENESFCKKESYTHYTLSLHAKTVFNKEIIEAKEFDKYFIEYVHSLRNIDTKNINNFNNIRVIRNHLDYIHGSGSSSPKKHVFDSKILSELATIWIELLKSTTD